MARVGRCCLVGHRLRRVLRRLPLLPQQQQRSHLDVEIDSVGEYHYYRNNNNDSRTSQQQRSHLDVEIDSISEVNRRVMEPKP